MRYSAARSGLLKAARMARTTRGLSKPISTKLEIADSYADPVAREGAVEVTGAGVVGAGVAVD